MILQNIIMPDEICGEQGLYYQADRMLKPCKDFLLVPAGEKVSFFSYMNMFDLDIWRKYTVLQTVIFRFEAKGIGKALLKRRNLEKNEVIARFDLTKQAWMSWQQEVRLDDLDGCCYLEIIAESDVEIRNAGFVSDAQPIRNVKIALNICTYQRNDEIRRNLKKLKHSRFFKPGDALDSKLQIMIVDNASELKRIDQPYIRLVHNPNTGGSGGFTRGLKEIRDWQKDTTHVIFMDDDVEYQMESFYRLVALLSYIREEYKSETVAGRMFRMDSKHIQYTAAEIWNCGSLRHIGFNADMTEADNVISSNENTEAEYGGWWFCCYPMEFAKNNDPLPFFLHCDDVEYGLRHGGKPLILNGIQVWHETYEYRQTPVVAYYDVRNTFFANQVLGCKVDYKKYLDTWFSAISEAHLKGDFKLEYCLILGLRHGIYGIEWLKQIDSEKNHYKLEKMKSNRYLNAFLWRDTKQKYQRKFHLHKK